MKRSIASSIILITSMFAIISVAGCASTSRPTATPFSTATAPTVTPVPSSTAGVTSSSLFDHSQFAWYQYTINASDMLGMSMIHTYKYTSETLDGQPALHANITQDMRPQSLVYFDIWSNPTDNSILKIHETVYKMDNLTYDADIAPANYSSFAGEDVASPQFSSAQLTVTGSGNLTIGNMTYATTIYSGSSGGQQYTYWVSPGVPVPVELTVQDSMGNTTYMLSGWGTNASMAPTISVQAGSPPMSMPSASMAPPASGQNNTSSMPSAPMTPMPS